MEVCRSAGHQSSAAPYLGAGQVKLAVVGSAFFSDAPFIRESSVNIEAGYERLVSVLGIASHFVLCWFLMRFSSRVINSHFHECTLG